MEQIHIGWNEFIENNKCLIDEILLKVYINDEETIYPNKDDIFRSLFYFGPADIKIVIIGQDPYISHQMIKITVDNKIINKKIPQAMGLSFSVPECHTKIPPSLKNIFKEIKNSYPDYEIPTHGSLKRWCEDEKILLLNSSLTVNEGKSNSHSELWKPLTDNLIKYISDKNNKTCFLLMGNFAQKKEILIDIKKHKIFKCIHPSPLSAHRGFLGCKIFKEINEYLEKKIKW